MATQAPVYRKTRCDHCGRKRKDCLWVQRVESGSEFVLCGTCRSNWRQSGHELVNVDPDFKDVAA